MDRSYRPRNAEETLAADVAFDKALAVGQVVEVAWTKGSGRGSATKARRYRANGLISTVNRQTVRVVTLEPASCGGDGLMPTGTTVVVPRWPWAHVHKGVFPRSTHLVRLTRPGGLQSTVRVDSPELAENVAAAGRAEGAGVEVRELP